MNKSLVQELKQVIEDAENYPVSSSYFATSLSTAKGTLANISNPLRNRNNYTNDTTLKRVIWNLRNSMRNEL